jgi:hypothetical protein
VKFKVPRTIRASIRATFDVIKDRKLLLWSLHVVLFPFYIFPSGLPQPADMVMLALAPMTLLSRRRRFLPDGMKPLYALIAFVAYTALVNIVWTLVTANFTANAKDGFLLPSVFYVFNALTFVTFLILYQEYGTRMVWLTVRLALISVVLQVTQSFLLRGYNHRTTLMFNSPNQLGYYALLTACMILIGQRRLKVSTIEVVAGLMACMYLALQSSSKAALASIAMLGLVIIVNRLRVALLGAIVLGALVATSNPFSDALDKAQERIEREGHLGFAEERGYDRIFNNPEYCVLGAGEGDTRRWAHESALGTHELHSSLGTLIFCYGIVGTMLFGAFLWRIMARTGFRAWLIMVPAFMYGLSHQGLRFTLLWVLLALVIGLKHLDRIQPMTKKKRGDLA